VEGSFLASTGTKRGAGANARLSYVEASKIRVIRKNLVMVKGTVQCQGYEEKAEFYANRRCDVKIKRRRSRIEDTHQQSSRARSEHAGMKDVTGHAQSQVFGF
jgi:hypothetical protein